MATSRDRAGSANAATTGAPAANASEAAPSSRSEGTVNSDAATSRDPAGSANASEAAPSSRSEDTLATPRDSATSADDSIASAAAAANRFLRLGAAVGITTWNDPFAAQTAIDLSAHVTLTPLRLGIRASLALCCALSKPNQITGDPLAVSLLAEAELPLLGPLTATLGAGAVYRTISAQVFSFADPAPLERQHGVEATLRPGLAVDLALLDTRLDLRLAGGTELRINRLILRVPNTPITLDPGPLSGWFNVGLAAQLF